MCLLLWGVNMVSTGLNRAFGTALRRSISNSTDNRFKAFFVGLFIAALLQSSTAASLIVSSFVARNVITVSAALAVMLGADVGTTVAAQFMSLDLSWLVPVMITAGFIVHKTMEGNQYKYVGRAVVGIGLALLALQRITIMSEPLKHSDALHTLIGPLTDQPVLAVALSALLTWFVHSSLGMILLYMGFVGSGTIPVELGLYMVLGANLGGAFAPVVMTLRDIPAGRRVPLSNLALRGMGVLFVMPFMGSLILPYIESLHPDPARMLVNFHMAFNMALALVFLPFIGPLTRIGAVVLPDRPREEDEKLPRYLDPTAIVTPPAALACVARETLRICDIVQKMLQDTLEVLRSNNARLVHEIRDRELVVDHLYESIKTYLVRLSGQALDKNESRRYMQILTFSTNLEHIGDIIDKNLLEMAMKKIRNQDNFSRQGFAEISGLHARVMESMHLAQNVFMTGDVKMARRLFEEKAILRVQEMHASESHFKRLNEGVAETLATSSLHLDILRDLRRINSYISLIAYPILEEAKELNQSLLKPPRAPRTKRTKSKDKNIKPPPPPELPPEKQ
ncbi:MAG: Na/Pi cotransporter family protein [Pseudomonadota bacterium]